MIDIREGIGAKTYFKYNKPFLSACGIWPFQSKINKAMFRFLWLTQEIIITVAESIKLVEIYKNVDFLLEAIPPFMYNRANDVIFANGLINQHKMKNLLRKIQNHWNSLTEESEIQILAKTAEFAMIIDIGYIGMVYSALCSCMLLHLTPFILDIVKPLNESRPLQSLFMVEFYVDPDKYFFVILGQNYVSALASPIPLIAMDMFFMNCTNHTCGMIRILGSRIDNISKATESKNPSKKNQYKQLCDCIDMHQSIFDFCDDINDTYSSNFLIVLFINMTLMSFTGVAAVIKMDDMSQFNDVIRFVVFTLAQIFHLFCFNYMGQSILTAIEMLEQKIYDVKWYEFPANSRVLVQVMILKNYRPTVMQAVLFPLSLQTFTSVMKTSMSYFTVIKSTR